MSIVFVIILFSADGREYALKLIEGTGISMSACREIAVSIQLVNISNINFGTHVVY